MMKRIISFLLAAVLTVGMLPPVQADAATVIHETALDEKVEIVTSEETEVQAQKTAAAATAAITRAQWLQLLVETFGYTMDSDVVLDNYYSDLSADAEYYADVMTAVYYGLVDVLPNGQLRPDDAATREFAAQTLNACMGYYPSEETYSFSESDSVTYPDDLQVAVERGWFALSSGAVLPEQPITAAEKNTMIADAEAYMAELELPEENPGNYTFKEGVVEIIDYAEIDSDGTTSQIRIYDISQPLEVGDTFVVYSGDLAIPFRADAISANAEYTLVTATDLFFEDAIETMDVQTASEADPLNYYANDDTELVFIEEDSGEVVTAEYASWAMARGTTKIYIPKYSAKLELGDAMTLSVSVELKNAKIVNKTKVSGTTGETSIYLDTDVEQNVKLSCELTKLGSDGIEIPLGGYDVDGIGGLDISLKIDVTGAISVVQKGHLKAGVKFGFNLLKMKFTKNLIYKYTEKGSSVNAEISAKICLEAKFGLYGKALPVKGYFYGEVGFQANVKYIDYDDIVGTCTHFAAHLFAEAGVKAEVKLLGVSNSWSYSKEFYKESNSPVKISAHYEDGVQVPECTRTDLEGTTTGTSSAIADSGYTTSSSSSYSGSGLSSGGSSTGYSSSGEPVIVYTYSLSEEKKATITGYSGTATSLTIPLVLDGYDVIAIGNTAFKGNTSLKTVVMQDNITTIGNQAFYGCTNLRNLTLSENLTSIGNLAFQDCRALTTVTIPDSVTTVGGSAFAYCYNLQYVRLSKGLTSLGGLTFMECDKLTSITIPKSLQTTVTQYYSGHNQYGPFYNCDNLSNITFETGISLIPMGLFANCPGVLEMEIPETVATIGNYAFYNCDNLETLTVPAAVTEINLSAFEGCGSLKSVTLSEGLTALHTSAFNSCGALTEIVIPNTVTVIGAWAFAYCTELAKVTLSGNLTELYAHAFFDCDKLTSIEIPKSLQSTTSSYYSGYNQYGPFYNCDNLSDITFEAGVTRIAQGLFANCPGVLAMDIPETVTVIGSYSFYNCDSLETLTVPAAVTEINQSAFESCNVLESVTLSEGLTEIHTSAFNSCTSLPEIVIPDTVTMIGPWAFAYGTDLERVTLSKGLIELYAHAFFDCDKLTAIEIPKKLETTTSSYYSGYNQYGPFYNCSNLSDITFEEGITRIPQGLFANCPGVLEMEIPDTVVTVAPYAFYNCDGLVSVTVPGSVTEINQNAFNGCNCLETVSLAEGLTAIYTSAFESCTALTEICIPDTVTVIGAWAFGSCSELAKVKLSKGLVELYMGAFFDCDKLTAIEIPKSLQYTSAAYYAGSNKYGPFYNCDGLTDVTFEEGITLVANALFANCPGIVSVEIPETVTNIAFQAFQNCPNLASVTLPEGLTAIGDRAFQNAASLTEIVIPDTVTNVGRWIFEFATGLESVTWTAGVTAIPQRTFNGCTALTTVNLPDTVVSFGESAFRDCDALVNFTMPDSVTTLDTYVFYDCAALEQIHLSESLTAIPAYTFQNCVALTSVEIPNSVTAIGNYAFSGCDALETVTMGDNVTSMGTYVFYHNDALKNVDLSAKLPKIPANTFQNCAALEEIVIPYYATAIDAYAFNASPKLKKVVTRSALASIATNAFSYPTVTVFYGDSGSYTETWASNNGYSFVANDTAAASVTLSDSALTIAKGKTAVLTATVEPADHADAITFKSSKPAVATVDDNGLITAVGVGTTTIKVTVGSVSASCKVTVTQGVTKITLSKTKLSLEVPNTEQLTATVTPADASNPTLAWTSSNEAAATVDENGLITAVGNGTAVITAAATDGSGVSASCTVTVIDPTNIPVSKITLNTASVSLEGLQTYQLTAVVAPADAANQTLAWTTSDEAVATVDATGLVTAVGKGSAVITAAATDESGVSATCTVTVANNGYLVTDPTQMESTHDYPSSCSDFWIYTVPGADSLAVTFDEQTYMEDDFDFLDIFDGEGNQVGEYTGDVLASQTITVPGDTVKIQIRSDGSGTDWGFKVTSVTAASSGPKITQQPVDVSVASGETAKVTVEATGDGLTYTWYYKNSGDDSFSLTNAFTSNTYSVTMSAARSGRQVYCIITDAGGNTVQSDTVTLSMLANEVEIVTQPVDVTVASGEKAVVAFEAQGDGLTYEWYYKNAGGTDFAKTAAFTTNTYEITMSAARSGRQVYCIVTDQYGNTAQTNTVTLSMSGNAVEIVTQPVDVTVASGETAKVTFEAEGDGLTYTWYYKNADADSFTKTASFTSNTYSITMSAARSGRQVYCIVTDQYGNSAKTDTVTLSMEKNEVTIVTQPKSVWVAEGKTAKVTVKATGDGLTYKWYYKNPGATKYTYTSSFKGNSYSITMSEARDGRYVYCKVTDAYGNTVKSKTVSLNMQTPLEIVTQPKSVKVASGEKAKVTVKATGDGLTYAWYYKNPGETKYTLTTSFTGNSYSITMNASRSGRYVYCKITDKYGNTVKTNTVSLRME